MGETKEFNLLKDVPVIHNTDELQLWLKPLYVIDNYMHDKDVYDEFMKKTLNVLRGSFCIRECREFPVKFKFYQKDTKTYSLEFRHFFINMILWYVFLDLEGSHVLNKDYIMDCKTEIPTINDYINDKLINTLREYNVKSTLINYDISHVLYNLRNISMDFSLLMGLNFSLNTFLDGYENNQELREMMEVKLDETMQPHEIESKLHEMEEREIEIFKSIPDHPVGVMLNANSGIKHKILCLNIIYLENLFNCWKLSLRQSATLLK